MVALVTGAASGIGAATARALAAKETALVLVDSDSDGLAALAGELAVPTLVLAHDVADEAAWDTTEATIRARFGHLTQAVVNAGIGEGQPLIETTLAAWRRVTAVNLDGAMLTLRTALRLMEDGGGGAIVTVASVAGLKAEPGAGAYCASKAALLHLTRVAAREAAPRGIRVNAVAPGGVDTPIWTKQPWFAELAASKGSHEAAIVAMAKAVPLGRFATAPEIADAILALLAAPMTTGATHVIDGGYGL